MILSINYGIFDLYPVLSLYGIDCGILKAYKRIISFDYTRVKISQNGRSYNWFKGLGLPNCI